MFLRLVVSTFCRTRGTCNKKKDIEIHAAVDGARRVEDMETWSFQDRSLNQLMCEVRVEGEHAIVMSGDAEVSVEAARGSVGTRGTQSSGGLDRRPAPWTARREELGTRSRKAQEAVALNPKHEGGSMRACRYVMVEEKISMEQQSAAVMLTFTTAIVGMPSPKKEKRKDQASSEAHQANSLETWTSRMASTWKNRIRVGIQSFL